MRREGQLKETLGFLQTINLGRGSLVSDAYASLLRKCAGVKALEEGKQVHAQMIINGIKQNAFLESKLVSMYGNCGNVVDARFIFDNMPKRNITSWNAMIRGYVAQGYCQDALEVYYQMRREDINPDKFTFPFVLKACAGLAALEQGKDIHDDAIRIGLQSDVYVENALIAMYGKCGNLESARHVFDKMLQRDVVSWTAMIAAYAGNGFANEALKVLCQMQLMGMKPDAVTITSVLPAIADLAALQKGKEIHDFVIKTKFESDVFVESALIDMYAKCGSITLARNMFDKMFKKNVVSWTAMIVGYGMHGLGEDALGLFSQMQRAGIEPNYVTYTGVLLACSHAGLVDQGWQYFRCMSRHYQITPRVEHYACMVDLLGRAGHMDEAHDFIKRMPLQPSARVWGALLGACKIHCYIDLGEHVAAHLFELEPENAGNYLLLSNIYAEAGRWDDVAKVRRMIKGRGVKRKPGYSWIEVKNRVHAFSVGDTSHPQYENIYAMAESLFEQMKEAGYVPDTWFVLHEE
eukprot:Gb_26340 [translate_table: standard]